MGVIQFSDAEAVMRRAIELASRGLGSVEPNPPVGSVVVDDRWNLLGEGFHEKFGGPHAEINALGNAGDRASGATLFVTLEPCCHTGKTGPCTAAILNAGIRRVVVGIKDPAPHADGGGIAILRDAGIEVEVGVLADETTRLTAPFAKRIETGQPYVHAKWAMTLDGKIATRTGSSQWISNTASREIVHRLRGRMDAIIVGRATISHDDPLLTARPAGPRTAVRVVVDSRAELSLDSQLVRTLEQAPVLVAAANSAPQENIRRLQDAGIEVFQLPVSETSTESGESNSQRPDLLPLLQELGRREMTHVLVEGGSRLLGSFLDSNLIDEVHVFLAPKIVGGSEAFTPVAGIGLSEIQQAAQIEHASMEVLDGDVYIHGPLKSRKAGKET